MKKRFDHYTFRKVFWETSIWSSTIFRLFERFGYWFLELLDKNIHYIKIMNFSKSGDFLDFLRPKNNFLWMWRENSENRWNRQISLRAKFSTISENFLINRKNVTTFFVFPRFSAPRDLKGPSSTKTAPQIHVFSKKNSRKSMVIRQA